MFSNFDLREFSQISIKGNELQAVFYAYLFTFEMFVYFHCVLILFFLLQIFLVAFLTFKISFDLLVLCLHCLRQLMNFLKSENDVFNPFFPSGIPLFSINCLFTLEVFVY